MDELAKIKEDMLQLRTDMTYVLYLLNQIQIKLDRIEHTTQQPTESIGIAPNTPGLNGPWMDEI